MDRPIILWGNHATRMLARIRHHVGTEVQMHRTGSTWHLPVEKRPPEGGAYYLTTDGEVVTQSTLAEWRASGHPV